MSPKTKAAWHAFRAALAELSRVDEERARLYLESATGALRGYARAVSKLGARS